MRLMLGRLKLVRVRPSLTETARSPKVFNIGPALLAW